jgi:hypothetical protein
MSDSAKPVTWKGDMLFGILSTRFCSTELDASAEHLVLTGPFGKRFALPATEIEGIETGQWSIWFLSGLRSGCIRIRHHAEGVPKRLLFSAKGIPSRQVAQELEKLGCERL